MSDSESNHYPIIIIGSGIAGLSAAIYAGRANNDPLIIHGDEPGGQLTLTSDVANYPGFPDGIGGTELVNQMEDQATQFGAETKHGLVDSIDESERPFTLTLVTGEEYTADAVIVASGASARTLGIPGEDDLMGFGVSTCATCDGAFFRGEDMVVVGGGDAAFEEAHFLTKFADTVYLVHRRDNFRAEAHWQERLNEKVESGDVEILTNTEATEINGTPDGGIESVTLAEHPEGHPTEKLGAAETNQYDLSVGAVFIAIGHTPNTGFLEETSVQTDETGYIHTQRGDGGGQTVTDVEGIFGAGDVVDHHYQQAVTAAGMGCEAAIDADEYLND